MQDLIKDNIINIDQPTKNQDLKIYENPMSNHNQGNNQGNNKGKQKYASANLVYEEIAGCVDEMVTVINFKGFNDDCGVTTHGRNVTIEGALAKTPISNTKSIPYDYNVIDELKRTLAQISIMELLKISAAHGKIFDEALVASTISTTLDTEQFSYGW